MIEKFLEFREQEKEVDLNNFSKVCFLKLDWNAVREKRGSLPLL